MYFFSIAIVHTHSVILTLSSPLLRPPHTQLCSIIVFGCVANQVQTVLFTTGEIGCGYNLNSDCCNFAIAVGVLGFLLCLAFLVKDVLFVIVDYSNNIVVSQYTW